MVFAFLIFAACSKSNGITKGGTKPSTEAVSGVFYVDDVNGKDNNTGKSESSAWKSLDKLNAVVFAAGSQVLFKSGGSWNGMFQFKGAGENGKPVIIGKYGGNILPKINANGTYKAALYIKNQQYFEVNGIELTNYNQQEEGGLTLAAWEAKNISDYAAVPNPPQAKNNRSFKFGLYIEAADQGQMNHIHLKNLLVHGVNGAIDQDSEDTKDNGGIALVVTGTTKETWFNDVLIEGCTIRDVDRTGLYTASSWASRTLTANSNWKPSTNVIIRNNTFKKTGANALIVRVANEALIEKNLFDSCAIKGSGNAAFNFNTDNTVFQFNEARFTKANVDDRDAGGLDSDYRTKNTIIQYNWLHDNDFGMLITGGGGVFNDNTVVRYNVIERDGKMPHPDHGKFIFKVSGASTNTKIYNNTIFIGTEQTETALIRHASWSGWPSNTSYWNNLFYNGDATANINVGSSTGNKYDKNMVMMNPVTIANNLAAGNTAFVNANNGPEGYKLKVGSAAIAAGIVISENGGKDFFGNSVSATVNPNIGAYNGSGL